MKWRTILPGLLGLLLPLPLLGLVYLAMSHHGARPSPPAGHHLVPMLSPEVRQGLRTYEQDCRTDADCEPQLRCFYNMRTGRQSCTDSTCESDEDCPEDFSCRTLRAHNKEDFLRACSLQGSRKEGELCDELPALLVDGCEKGLICSGFCGRPCHLEEPSSCPEGYVCKEGDHAPLLRAHLRGPRLPRGPAVRLTDGRAWLRLHDGPRPGLRAESLPPGAALHPQYLSDDPGTHLDAVSAPMWPEDASLPRRLGLLLVPVPQGVLARGTAGL